MSELSVDAKLLGAQLEKALRQKIDRGLDRASQRLLQVLIANAPSNPNTTTNKYKDSFHINRTYKNVRYIGNTKVIKRGGSEIPLSNLLEYQGNHEGHMRRAYDQVEDELIAIILSELN